MMETYNPAFTAPIDFAITVYHWATFRQISNPSSLVIKTRSAMISIQQQDNYFSDPVNIHIITPLAIIHNLVPLERTLNIPVINDSIIQIKNFQSLPHFPCCLKTDVSWREMIYSVTIKHFIVQIPPLYRSLPLFAFHKEYLSACFMPFKYVVFI